MLPDGVYHWAARHPEWEGPVSAYAIDDGERLILIDPIAVPDDVRALFGNRGLQGAPLEDVSFVQSCPSHMRSRAIPAGSAYQPAGTRVLAAKGTPIPTARARLLRDARRASLTPSNPPRSAIAAPAMPR
jgi:hypothetical protein